MDCNSIYLACGLWLIFFFSWKRPLIGNNSFTLQYVFYRNLPQCTDNDPVWHAEWCPGLSRWGTETGEPLKFRSVVAVRGCWMTVAFWKSDPVGGWNPESCCLSVFLSHLRGPITCADRLGLRLWCIWAQSQPTATKSSLWSIQHTHASDTWRLTYSCRCCIRILVYYFFRIFVALTAP